MVRLRQRDRAEGKVSEAHVLRKLGHSLQNRKLWHQHGDTGKAG